MYYLSVGALFKNESSILREWIEHYLFHGVEHFYLIDDNSSDDFMTILKPYMDKGIVTLFQHTEPWTYYLGRQSDMYQYFIFPKIGETKWLAMLDIDEYLWSPRNIDITETLRGCEHLGQIQIRSTIFGSNGYIQQPEYVVKAFTKRAVKIDGGFKYIINTSYSFHKLTVHHAIFIDKKDEKEKFIILSDPAFVLNHYSCQSQEYWNTIKCTRGDSDNYRSRSSENFHELDINEIEDDRLYQQNKSLFHSE